MVVQKKGSDSEVVLSWELLREMVGEENVVNGVFMNPNGTAASANAPNALPERVFARDYTRQSLALKNRLSAGQFTAASLSLGFSLMRCDLLPPLHLHRCSSLSAARIQAIS